MIYSAVSNERIAKIKLMIELPDTDEDLLRQCRFEAFRASGPGGQHVNKTESAVRLTHLPSGLTVTARATRSQYRNKQLCLEKLREKVRQLKYHPVARVATRPKRSAKNKTLAEKALRSRLKQLRSKRLTEE